MRIKSHWFKAETPKSPQEIASAAAFIIFRVAQNSLKTMRAARFELPPGAQYFAFLSEFLTFLVLGADRLAHARGDEAWRVAFTTAVAHRVGEILAENESDLLGAATAGDGQAPLHRPGQCLRGGVRGPRLDQRRSGVRFPALARPSGRRGDGRHRPDLGHFTSDRGRGARGRRDAAPRNGGAARCHAANANQERSCDRR